MEPKSILLPITFLWVCQIDLFENYSCHIETFDAIKLYIICIKNNYLPAMISIPPLLSFYKDDFDIKYPMKADMPLKKEIKTIYRYHNSQVHFDPNISYLRQIIHIISSMISSIPI